MKVTVAIPCYNGADYIGQTIESILTQTYPPDQILVIDDGSTDDSVDVIGRYPVQLAQHFQNQGLSNARNSAINEASGDIIVFVDVDAFANPHLVATLLAGYSNKEIGGVGGQGIESNIISLADRWRRAHATQGHGETEKFVGHLYGLCMSYRLSVLKEVGGFNPDFRTNAEDVDIGLRINQAGYRLRYLPEARVYHQRRDDETSLKRAMTAWYAAGYQAKRLNQAQPWRLFAGTMRRLITDPLSDLLWERDVKLARLSWQMGLIKWRALLKSRSS